MHFCAQEQCKSLAHGDLLAGGPLPLAADEMLQHLLCEAMAAGCLLQTLALQEGPFLGFRALQKPRRG